jgi:hypothetical protein
MKNFKLFLLPFFIIQCNNTEEILDKDIPSTKIDLVENSNYHSIDSLCFNLSNIDKNNSNELILANKTLEQINSTNYFRHIYSLYDTKLVNENDINNSDNKNQYILSKEEIAESGTWQDYYVLNSLLIPIGKEKYVEGDDEYVSFFFDENFKLRKIRSSEAGYTLDNHKDYYFDKNSNLPFYYRYDYNQVDYFTGEPVDSFSEEIYFSSKRDNPDTLCIINSIVDDTLTNKVQTIRNLEEMISTLKVISEKLGISNLKNLKKELESKKYVFLSNTQWENEIQGLNIRYFMDENKRFYQENKIRFKNPNIFFLHPKMLTEMMPSWGEGEIIKRKNYLDQYSEFRDSRIHFYGDRVLSYYESGGFIDYKFLGVIVDGMDTFAIDSDEDYEQTDENNNTLGVYLVRENTGGSLTKCIILLIHFTDIIEEARITRFVDLKGLLHLKNIRDNEVKVVSDCRVCRDQKFREKIKDSSVLEEFDLNFAFHCSYTNLFNLYHKEIPDSLLTGPYISYGSEKFDIYEIIGKELYTNDFEN